MKKLVVDKKTMDVMVENENKEILLNSENYKWVGGDKRAKMEMHKWIVTHVASPSNLTEEEYNCLIQIIYALEEFFSVWDKTTKTLFKSNVDHLKHLSKVAFRIGINDTDRIEKDFKAMSHFAGFETEDIEVKFGEDNGKKTKH